MKKYLLRIIFILIAAYAVYATWVMIDHDPSDPYDRKEINIADYEKIKRISEERKNELSNQEVLDRIASGESPKPPISQTEAVRMSEEFFQRYCRQNNIIQENYEMGDVSSSGNYMWLVKFISKEKDSKDYWVKIDKLGSIKVLDHIKNHEEQPRVLDL